MAIPEIIRAEFPRMREEIVALLLEYERELVIDPCFHTFEAEIAGLPGPYSPGAGGAFLVAQRGDERIDGCVALKRVTPNSCEMKRLFVRSSARGTGLGRRLAEIIVEEGRRLDYATMRLDTIPASMKAAIQIYRSLGFGEVEPWTVNPNPEVLFMELQYKPVPKATHDRARHSTDVVGSVLGSRACDGGGCGGGHSVPAR